MRILLAFVLCFPALVLAQPADWRVGLATVDITPDEPVPMSGYASRRTPFEAVAQPLFAKGDGRPGRRRQPRAPDHGRPARLHERAVGIDLVEARGKRRPHPGASAAERLAHARRPARVGLDDGVGAGAEQGGDPAVHHRNGGQDRIGSPEGAAGPAASAPGLGPRGRAVRDEPARGHGPRRDPRHQRERAGGPYGAGLASLGRGRRP